MKNILICHAKKFGLLLKELESFEGFLFYLLNKIIIGVTLANIII